MTERQRKIKIQVLPDIHNKDLPELSQTLLSPQSEPMIIRTPENQISGALMIEHAFLQGTTIELHGWSVGHCEFGLLCGEQSIPCELTRRSRKDVAEALAVAESGDGLGFCIQATATSLENCLLGWSLNVEGHVNQFGFPLQAVDLSAAHGTTPAAVTGAADQDIQVFSSQAKSKAHICFDRFVGPNGLGWAVNEGGEGSIVNVIFGGVFLGQTKPKAVRLDVQDIFDLAHAEVGFAVMLGGPLQFSIMSKACRTLVLTRPGQPKMPCQVDLTDHLAEALTFSPLRAFSRHPEQAKLGMPRSLRFLSGLDVAMMFEAGSSEANAVVYIDFYQEQTPGHLSRLEHFEINSAGQIINLEFRLISRYAPILIVVTDKKQNIILTDTLLMPSLFLGENTALVDYHSMLGGGKVYYDEIAKISRNYLDWAIKNHRKEIVLDQRQPRRENTVLVLFVRDDFDPVAEIDAEEFKHISDSIVFLERDGTARSADKNNIPFAQFVETADARFFVFCELNATLRPDFWAILTQCRANLADHPELVYWDAIASHDTQRAHLIKQPLLLDAVFRSHDLLYANSVMVQKQKLIEALNYYPADFRSGRLRLEHAFCQTDSTRVVRIPFVMDFSRISLPTPKQKEAWARQTPVCHTPPDGDCFKQTGGVSIIINYRDSEQQTLCCLDAIRLQEFSGDIEIILVNNGSLPDVVERVCARAEQLFTPAAVKAIDYSETFNHSKQCNIAAKVASHDFLLMLSNDSALITPKALAMAREVAAIPWVGSCGFRVIGSKNGKLALQSLGLAVGRGSDVFSGGPFLTHNIVPDFVLDKTIEVIGNTFAVVMLRKEVYWQLNGLDEDTFPTNYNDVDFSLRASALGYRHVALGAAVVEHVGRGSREFDLDLPIEQSIYDRAPPLKVLTAIGTIKL